MKVTSTAKNYYQLLGVKRGSSELTISTARDTRCDVYRVIGTQSATAHIAILKTAAGILLNSDTREAYDNSLEAEDSVSDSEGSWVSPIMVDDDNESRPCLILPLSKRSSAPVSTAMVACPTFSNRWKSSFTSERDLTYLKEAREKIHDELLGKQLDAIRAERTWKQAREQAYREHRGDVFEIAAIAEYAARVRQKRLALEPAEEREMFRRTKHEERKRCKAVKSLRKERRIEGRIEKRKYGKTLERSCKRCLEIWM